MKTENLSIRKAARVADVPLWKVAAALGISEPTLFRWLRFPLAEEVESKILRTISELEREVV